MLSFMLLMLLLLPESRMGTYCCVFRWVHEGEEGEGKWGVEGPEIKGVN